MKYGISLALILIVALSFYALGVNHSDQSKVEKKIRVLKKESQELSDSYYREYLSLKDQKAKYEKADELIEKMFLMLFAQLEIKKPKVTENQTQNTVPDPKPDPTPSNSSKKNSGIEVIVDPYNDVVPKLNSEIESLKAKISRLETEKKMPKRFSQNAQEKLFFADKIGKGRPPIDGDIFSQQWKAKKPLDQEKELQRALKSHLKGYLGIFDAEYRSPSLEVAQAFLKLEVEKSEKEVIVNFSFKGKQNLINLEQKFIAYHSITHSNIPGGSCRAIILHNENYQVHIVRFKNKSNKLLKSEMLMRFFSIGKKVPRPIGNAYIIKQGENFNTDYRGRY